MTELEAAYLAGLIDGEGTVTMIRETKYRYPCVSVASTSFELVERCKKISGLGAISSKRAIRELAKLAGVSVSTIYALENAKRNATVRTLVRLDNILSS